MWIFMLLVSSVLAQIDDHHEANHLTALCEEAYLLIFQFSDMRIIDSAIIEDSVRIAVETISHRPGDEFDLRMGKLAESGRITLISAAVLRETQPMKHTSRLHRALLDKVTGLAKSVTPGLSKGKYEEKLRYKAARYTSVRHTLESANQIVHRIGRRAPADDTTGEDYRGRILITSFPDAYCRIKQYNAEILKASHCYWIWRQNVKSVLIPNSHNYSMHVAIYADGLCSETKIKLYDWIPNEGVVCVRCNPGESIWWDWPGANAPGGIPSMIYHTLA